MTIGGNHPPRHPDAIETPEGTFIPSDLEILHAQSLIPEVDGQQVVLVSFTCVVAGAGLDQEEQTVRLLLPVESFIEMSTTLSREALRAMAMRSGHGS